MRYREPLPKGCPPPEATEIREPRSVFRLVRSDPATSEDFRSHREEKGPGVVFRGVDECRARGLSVYESRESAAGARRFPHLRGRRVCRVELAAGAGSIRQTGAPPHYTWWPLADFDILAASTVEPR